MDPLPQRTTGRRHKRLERKRKAEEDGKREKEDLGFLRPRLLETFPVRARTPTYECKGV